MLTVLETNLDVENAVYFRGMTIIPVIEVQPHQNGDYMLIADAIRDGHIQIKEMKSSSVPHIEIEVINPINRIALGYKGEILVGGGQTRQLIYTVLLDLSKKTVHRVPVQCVERKRWNPTREKEFTSGTDLTSSCVRHGTIRRVSADQSATWETIKRLTKGSGTVSHTMSYNDTVTSYRSGTTCDGSVDQEEWEEKVKRFNNIMNSISHPREGQIGVAAIALHPLEWSEKKKIKPVVYLEFVETPKMWESVHEKIAMGFAIEGGLIDNTPDVPMMEPEEKILKKFEKALKGSKQRGIGLEERISFEQEGGVAAETTYRGDTIIHFIGNVVIAA